MTDASSPRRGWGIWRKFLLGAVLVIVASGGATATAGLLEVQSFVNDINAGGHGINSHEITRAQAGQPQTILILGSDKRFHNGGVHDARSDTIILARFDPGSPATTVMSIPRDLKVNIPRPGGAIQSDKINAAYSIGGPELTAKVVKQLLHTPINHIVNVNFRGFREAVDYIHCVYTDVDRRYFNDNSEAGPGADYATINIPAGYQKLCGADALDYVRFRHADTDIVRSARQQDFLRQAKQQYGVKRLIDNRHQLAQIFGRYTQSDSDLHSLDSVLKLMTLVAFSAQNPIREVHFPAILPNDPKDPYVRANPDAISKAVRQFLNETASSGPRAPARPAPGPPRAPRHTRGRPSNVGLVDASSAGQAQAAALGRAGMPVYVPTLLTQGGTYMGPTPRVYPRGYNIPDQYGHAHKAYRLVVFSGFLGQYYGVQGTTWQDPPILQRPSEIRTVGGKRLELYFDGSRLRLVARRTRDGVYWLSNTLLETLTNQEMLGIAASLRPARVR